MYKLTKPDGTAVFTEKPNFIRVHKTGCYLLCFPKKDESIPANAEGVSISGTPYLFKDGAMVHEVDGGQEIENLKAENEALREQLAETDEAAIELYEAHMTQEAVNAEQDEAIIEIYEAMEGIING